ncbi:actin cortical patch SUR7/pH-response regulator pali [Amylostereum chailletii]|nr:actin cortical patch SUR7/pH-response regulator pali [Amylostereum chailletii]
MFKLRGELCIGVGSFLSFAGLLLLIFVHVGQINTSTVPRQIAMAKMNVSQYGDTLRQGFAPDPITGLYTDNASAPLGVGAGIRNVYDFGLYSYCGYLDSKNGTCTKTTAGSRYEPYDVFTSDMTANYSRFTSSIINGTAFRDSNLLGGHTHSAYYLILLGTILTFVALFLGFVKHTFTFLISTAFAAIATLFILVGAALWTSAINQSQVLNGRVLAGTNIPVNIEVSFGTGMSLLWAAFACLFASLIPYIISCCTYRG